MTNRSNQHPTSAVRTRILQYARQLFTRFGVRTVRMGDVAEGLGLSKKTLYQYFTTKEDLLGHVLESYFEHHLQRAIQLQSKAPNTIVGAWLIWDHMVFMRQTTPPTLLRDIECYFPAVWTLCQKFRERYLDVILIAHFKQGIQQGLYRADLDQTSLALLWVSQSEWLLTHAWAKPSVKHHFVRGLLSAGGLAVYEANVTGLNLL